MTCQRCSDEASVHLTEKVDGRRRELHLCLVCAREAGLALPATPPPLGLDAVVQALIVAHVGELTGRLAESACPVCGLKFMEFRTRGQLGCSHDYEVFRQGLLPLIARKHGATRHVGKAPKRSRVAADRVRLELRSDLRDAIALEDYEQAARIRDRLRLKDADR